MTYDRAQPAHDARALTCGHSMRMEADSFRLAGIAAQLRCGCTNEPTKTYDSMNRIISKASSMAHSCGRRVWLLACRSQ